MAPFRAVLIEHGYSTTRYEREVIEAAGGELVDADAMPLDAALRLCEEADAVLCRRIRVTRPMLERFRRCRIIVRYGVGTDNIDVEAATDLGIIVGHVPSYCTDEVSSHAIAMLLSIGAPRRGDRPAGAGRRVGRPSRRSDAPHGGPDTRDRRPGRHRARGGAEAGGLGLRLIAADPFAEPQIARELGVELADFDTLCRQSDFVSLHCPLLPETHHLVGASALSLVRPGAILVNTARGPLVDTASLLLALDEGRLAGAALDVFEDEPLPAGSPLRHHEKLVLTDHTAWYSEESQVELQRTAAEAVATVCTGGLPGSLANPLVLKTLGRWNEWQPAENMRWQLKRLGLT